MTRRSQHRLATAFPLLPAILCVIALSVTGTSQKTAPAPGALELTSPLGRKLYALHDDTSVTTARTALAADPGNAALALKLSLAQAGRRQYNEAVAIDTAALALHPEDPLLLLERGHRELGLRNFAAAQADLEHAAKLAPDNLDIFYHLGLSHYFQRQFKEAATALARARALATSDDSLIDCSAWLYNAERRAGDDAAAGEVLMRITPAVKNTSPHLYFYLQLLHFYRGMVTAEEILPMRPTPDDTEAELSFNTITYGVGNWKLSHHEDAAAADLFRKVVQGEAWNAWGFIGSETELAHMQP